jgi:hypothetical protein
MTVHLRVNQIHNLTHLLLLSISVQRSIEVEIFTSQIVRGIVTEIMARDRIEAAAEIVIITIAIKIGSDVDIIQEMHKTFRLSDKKFILNLRKTRVTFTREDEVFPKMSC